MISPMAHSGNQNAQTPVDMQYNQQLNALADWVAAADNVLMPVVPNTKRPMFPHRNEQWSWEKFFEHNFQTGSMVGLLLQSLICVDSDSEDMHIYLLEQFPSAFDGAVHAKTTKGHHYIWFRSLLCEGANLTDTARLLDPDCVPAYLLDAHGEVPFDVKTVTSTGTSGLLVVAPSAEKRWICAPWDLETLLDIPDDIVKWICKNL